MTKTDVFVCITIPKVSETAGIQFTTEDTMRKYMTVAESKMKFDDILKQIGEFGCYQKQIYLAAALPSIILAFEGLSAIFTFFIPKHR